METRKFSIDKKTVISLKELKSLMHGATCNGLTELRENEKLIGTEFIGKFIYEAAFYTNKKGLNIYRRNPQVRFRENGVKSVVHGNSFRLGTITFKKQP